MTHKPTKETREMVKSLSGYGVPQDDICHILDITKPTLHKHYRREIDVGFAQANAKVGQSLYNQAVSGNTTAAIFWMKARAGWRETMQHDVNGDMNVLFKTILEKAPDDGDSN